MKYDLSIEIKKPLNRVIDLFSDPKRIVEWQTGFIKYEHLSGEFGAVGSINRLHFKQNGRIIVLDELVEVVDLPENFTAIYTTKGIWNKNVNSFVALDEKTTLWHSYNEFKFLGAYKFLRLFVGKTIKKQSGQTLKNFKQFAESLD